MINWLVALVDKIVAFLNRFFPPMLVQFGVYASIGVIGALMDLGVFTLLYKYFSVYYLIAFFIGKSIGIINNFFMNSVFNFKKKDNLFKRFISFYTIGLIGMGVGSLLMYVLVDLYKGNALLMNVIVTFFIAVIQFLVNRVVSFRNMK